MARYLVGIISLASGLVVWCLLVIIGGGGRGHVVDNTRLVSTVNRTHGIEMLACHRDAFGEL